MNDTIMEEIEKLIEKETIKLYLECFEIGYRLAKNKIPFNEAKKRFLGIINK